MNGLEQTKIFYGQTAEPMLKQAFPDLFPRMAMGLVGEGSECFGFDDGLSHDHDWAMGFCIWLDREDFLQYGQQVNQIYEGICTPMEGRRGCFCIQEWYGKYLGVKGVPQTLAQWRNIPTAFLATATNGAVFYDGLGGFSEIRNTLLQGYPQDVARKKLSYQLAIMAQAGQYNYPRCLQREDWVGAQLALSLFSTATMEGVYLLNQRYAPYYKWMHRGLGDLPVLSRVAPKLTRLATHPLDGQQEIEAICTLVRGELARQTLSHEADTFLISHSHAVLATIQDPTLRSTHCMEP